MPHLFCFGYGYSASFIAKNLLQKGWKISGLTRSDEKIRQNSPSINLYKSPPKQVLKDATHFLISIPPDDQIYSKYPEEIKGKSISYLSSTGVYGNHDGAWIDEKTPPKPSTERGKMRLKMEKEWIKLDANIFRLSGIYGPGRNIAERLKRGEIKQIPVKRGHYFNRIHVKDIAQIVCAAIEKNVRGEIYNCADDHPCSYEEVVFHAAKSLKIQPPPLVNIEDADISPMLREFFMDNRRVKNNKIKLDLSVNLLYDSHVSSYTNNNCL